MPPFCFGRGAMRFAPLAQASKTDKALVLVITPFGIGKHRNLRLFCGNHRRKDNLGFVPTFLGFRPFNFGMAGPANGNQWNDVVAG